MIKAILFDIDGTLVDSNDAHAETWVKAFAKFGYDIPYEVIRPLMGMGGDQLVPTVLKGLKKESEVGEEISAYRKKLFLEKYAPKLQPTNGARQLVEACKEKGLKMIVATSASEEELHVLLKAANVEDLLTEYTSASDVKASKPAGDIVAAALKKVDVKPHEALLIGDTPYDIASAEKCGVSVIALRCGGFSDALLTNALSIYTDPKDLADHFEETLQKRG